MLEVALKEAKQAGACRISEISILVGEISGVARESVEFYFGFLKKDTIAEGASLKFKEVPFRLKCRKCGEIFKTEGETWQCPACGERSAGVESGREFMIEGLEVE